MEAKLIRLAEALRSSMEKYSSTSTTPAERAEIRKFWVEVNTTYSDLAHRVLLLEQAASNLSKRGLPEDLSVAKRLVGTFKG